MIPSLMLPYLQDRVTSACDHIVRWWWHVRAWGLFYDGANFSIGIEPKFMYGPDVWHVYLMWNRRDLLSQRPVLRGECLFADEVSLVFGYPRAFYGRRGLILFYSGYHMKWDQV